MNFRKLKIFYETANCLNMTKVAREMFISQPSISQSINELEVELGVKLFDRIGKKLYLTHEGEVFLNYVRRMLNLYEEAKDTLKNEIELNRGKITIGASTTIGIYILPRLIRKFSKKYKNIEISIIIENTSHLEELLLENKIDFAFVEGNINSSELKTQKIWEDELVLISGEDHNFKNKSTVSASELINEKLIMRECGSGTRTIAEDFFKAKEIPYKIYLELGNTEAIKRTVEANLGIGCVSLMSVYDEVSRETLNITRFEEGKIFRDLLLVIHKDKYISNSMKQFITFAETIQ